MKNRASGFLKQVISVLGSVAKAKSLALKTKTSAIKTRLLIFSLLRDKKLPLVGSISHKLQALLGHHQHGQHSSRNEGEDDDDDKSKALVLYDCAMANPSHTQLVAMEEEEEEEKYPDLTHSLFESEVDLDGPGEGSVIEMVRNSKEDFKLEDEIDEVADLFIRQFHRQMRMQKQLSLKRFQEMLERGL